MTDEHVEAFQCNPALLGRNTNCSCSMRFPALLEDSYDFSVGIQSAVLAFFVLFCNLLGIVHKRIFVGKLLNLAEMTQQADGSFHVIFQRGLKINLSKLKILGVIIRKIL